MTTSKRRIIVSALAVILLLVLYYVIFSFSDQEGQVSGSVSLKVSETCVEIADKLHPGSWTAELKKSMAEFFQDPIRKLAHFTEYTCMGILVYILWRQWRERGWALYLLTVGWVCLSAVADEFHQSFVPGREASILDVLLDTGGGVFGLLICLGVEVLCRRVYLRRRVQKGA